LLALLEGLGSLRLFLRALRLRSSFSYLAAALHSAFWSRVFGGAFLPDFSFLRGLSSSDAVDGNSACSRGPCARQEDQEHLPRLLIKKL